MRDPTPRSDHEQNCIDAADHFTAVRGRGERRTVVKCANWKAAKEQAQKFDDGRTMIYAVTADGASAHIENA